MKKQRKSFNTKLRFKAMLAHSLFSLILLGLFMVIVLRFWFPGPHFLYNGGWDGAKILIPVDLVAGPLITFFIFNTNKSKKELVIDLSIILSIQICFFLFGLYKVESVRPAAQVLTYKGHVKPADFNDVKSQLKIYNSKKVLNKTNNRPPFYYADSSYKNENTKKQQDLYAILPGMHDAFATFMYEDPTSKSSLEKIKKMSVQSKEKLLFDDRYKKAINNFEKSNKGNFYFFAIFLSKGAGVMVLSDKGYPIDYLAMHYYKK